MVPLMIRTEHLIFNAMLKKFVFIAAIAAIAASCSKEIEKTVVNNDENDVNPASVVFTAGIDTKAAISGSAIVWEDTDQLTLWNGTQTATYSTTDSGASATFTTSDSFDAAASYTAIYPADGSAVFSAGSVTTTLPAVQSATDGNFDPAAHIAVATTTTTDLAFHNAVAYLKFSVPTGMDDLVSVTFAGNNSENVAGACSVNTGSYALTATGSTTAKLSGTFDEGHTYYLAIAPQNFSKGYTVTIERTSRTYDMVSTKDVTINRNDARNIGELWDGSYLITGTAIAAPTDATMTVGPRTNSNTALKEYTFSYSGALSAGTVAIKKAYASTNVASATVPADGWYHVFYNETTDTFKVYDQELSVNFGQTKDMIMPIASMNNLAGYTSGSNVTLYDYNIDAESTVVVTIGSGFTGNYTNDSYDHNDAWEFWLDDYYFKSGMLYNNLIISKSNGTGDSSPATITVSGLNASKKYDIRISGGRGGGSLAVRQTKITIGSSDKTYNQGLDGTGSKPATSVNFRAKNVAVYEGVSPDGSGNIEINVVSVDTGTVNEAHVGCIFISRVVE